MNAEAITAAIREVIRGELGSVRTVPVGEWIEGVPAQLGMHGGLDGDTARRLRAEGRRLFDVEVAPARRTGAVGSSAASHSLLAITTRIVLWLPITLVAETVSADHRYAARADALEQAQVIREAIEWPGNLLATADGTPTGIVSGRLGEAQTPRIVREDWSRGLYEIELRFSGYVQRSAETPAAPVFVRPPSAYVVDADEATVGGTLIADPGEVTGAHTTRGQWLRDGAELEGETRVLYEIVEPDEGAALSYRATAIGSGGTVSAKSAPIVVGGVAPLPDGFPIPDPGLLLIAGHGTDEPTPGAGVQTWRDLGGGGCSFGAELVTSRPSLEVVPAMGGLRAVKFRASDATALTCASREILREVYYPVTGATAFAAFFNPTYPSGTTQETILDAANLATNAPNFTFGVSGFGGGALAFRIGAQGATVVNETLSPGVPAGVPHFVVIRLRMSPAPHWEVRVDGSVLASGAFAAPPSSGPTPSGARVGSRNPTALNHYNGYLGALGHIPRRLEGDELAALETWLARYKP